MSRRKPIRYDPSNDFYVVLGVLPSASMDDIHKSFRLRAKEVHPDRNPENAEWAHLQFQRLNDAYDVLNDAALRTEYDTRRRVFTKERAPDGTAWWDRPHPASGPYGAANSAANGAASATTSGPMPFDAPSRTMRQSHPVQRRKAEMRPYQMLFIISSLLLVGSICASMTAHVRVVTPSAPQDATDAPTQAISSDTGSLCLSPNALISDPPYAGEVAGGFNIRGTASGPHFMSYRVDIRPSDMPPSGVSSVPEWIPLMPAEQMLPVEHGILVPDSQTADLAPGNYLIRLTVRQDDGLMMLCWWPILKTR